MSILLEHNKQVINVIKEIESQSKKPVSLEEDFEVKSPKEELIDLIENTVNIIAHLQNVRDPYLKKAKEFCLKELFSLLKLLSLKSTISFVTIYQNILNGKIKSYKFD